MVNMTSRNIVDNNDFPTIFPTMPSIFKRPRSPYYFCSYRSHDGRWLKKSTKQRDRSKALTICLKLEEAEKSALHGTLTTSQARKLFNEILLKVGDEPLENFTIASWVQEWLTSKSASRTEGTAARYEKPINDFIAKLGDRANLPLRAITPKDVRSFRDAETKLGKSPVTVNLAHKTIAGAMAAAVRMGYLDSNPAMAVGYLPTHQDRVEKTVFTPEDVTKLHAAAPSEDWKGVILVGYYSGLWLGDAIALKWGNVDLPNCMLTVTPKKTARLGKKLMIPMHPDLETFLLGHPAGNKDADPVFSSLAGLVIGGRNGASRAFKTIMKAAGVAAGEARKKKGKQGRAVSMRSFHSLRHSYVSGLSAAGVPVELRQKLAGHASEQQNLHYTHPEVAALRAAIDKLPRITTKK